MLIQLILPMLLHWCWALCLEFGFPHLSSLAWILTSKLNLSTANFWSISFGICCPSLGFLQGDTIWVCRHRSRIDSSCSSFSFWKSPTLNKNWVLPCWCIRSLKLFYSLSLQLACKIIRIAFCQPDVSWTPSQLPTSRCKLSLGWLCQSFLWCSQLDPVSSLYSRPSLSAVANLSKSNCMCILSRVLRAQAGGSHWSNSAPPLFRMSTLLWIWLLIASCYLWNI